MPSTDPAAFRDRAEAGHALGAEVAAHLGQDGVSGRPLVLALPRGGVPVGYEVAGTIGGDLDVVVARKIGMPGRPEFGIGAVSAHGPPMFGAHVHQVDLTGPEITATVAAERAEARRRLRRYRGDRPPPDVAGRTVIVVDDGVATGVTATAALRQLRMRNPRRLVFATPVCAVETGVALGKEADAIVCLRVPTDFTAVGAWYEDYRQLTDEDVEAILAEAWNETR
ncbi:phosphoribosyltransferase family protein [Phytohabitans sp. ZYX-F-186]|uniref:Phosphoribosyltransferase family protein n=1 Tax=Phytohabitans maris TaxID=3071409 RepID=A0ABU0ZD83_9ACTN|nr:phosphoribosyltransferase family protein [Phytohabitans sp. ZYX-F-186]MDQ7905024.1 phosphoribosyltransferase family protein [Phytohabitans sp. ZYX-F-186]